jgi:hypothetical protein
MMAFALPLRVCEYTPYRCNRIPSRNTVAA